MNQLASNKQNHSVFTLKVSQIYQIESKAK